VSDINTRSVEGDVQRTNGLDLKRFARWETVTVFLLICSILYGVSTSDDFFTGGNLNSILSDISEIALIALPLTLVIIAAEIDLSVASVLGLTCALMGYLWNHGWPMEMIIPAVLVAGGLAGALNGALVTRLGLPSLAVTIGTLAMYRGLAYVILGDQAVADFPQEFTNWGFGSFAGTQIPNPMVMFAILAVIFGVTLHMTGIGRSIFAMGANEEAAHFSGVRVKRIKFWLFVVTGMVSALAGIVFTFRFASARADNALGLELSVVAVVLLGGVSIFGGKGNLLGVICATLLLGTLRNALTLNDVSAEVLTIVTGSLLLFSVLGPSVTARVREALRRGRSADTPPPTPTTT
jgi:rhamnose transport system permease protein